MILKRWVPWWGFLGLMLLAIFTVWLRLAIIQTTYEVHTIHQEIQALKQKKQILSIQLTQLRCPKRLQEIAKSEFGFLPAKPEQMIYILKE